MARKKEPDVEVTVAAKRGRPSQFRPEFCDQVTKLCRLGATDVDLAEFFGVTHTTLNTWKVQHPDFLASIRAGKIEADMQVANSLFKRATGYVVEVEKVIGQGDNRKVVKLNVAVEPDTQACIFWLKNRRRDQWRDKQELDVNADLTHRDAAEPVSDTHQWATEMLGASTPSKAQKLLPN